MDFGIVNVSSITAIAFLAGMTWKRADTLNDKWIPTVCGTLGMILGIAAFMLDVPDFPATDVLSAAAIGIVSGFAATGIHQAGKQLSQDE